VADPRPTPSPAAEPESGGALPASAALTTLLRTDRTTWFTCLSAAIVLTVSRYHASTGEYSQIAGKFALRGGLFAVAADSLHLWRLGHWLAAATGPTADYLYWFLASLVLFMAPLVAVAGIPGVRAEEFGIGAGDWRFGLKASAVIYLLMVPFVVAASFTPMFAGQYPMCPGATSNWRALAIYELCYAAYFVGWEFVYRGLLCNGLYPRYGAVIILMQAIPFAVMHAGKPEPEAYGSIVAAMALGVIAVRARSFWYGAGLHSAVATTMDALALTHSHHWPKHW
jgi:hypothetical protein